MSDRYYASVFGGQVCRDCGSVVMDLDAHDEFHHALRLTHWVSSIPDQTD